jgi:hypothetical protein
MLQEKRQAESRNALMQQESARQQQQSDQQNQLFKQANEDRNSKVAMAAADYVLNSKTPKDTLLQLASTNPQVASFMQGVSQEHGIDWNTIADADVLQIGQNIKQHYGAQAGIGPAAPKPMMVGKDETFGIVGADNKFTPQFTNTAPTKPVQTNDMAEYQLAKDQGFKGNFFDYQTELKRAGANSVSTTVHTGNSLYGGMAGEQAKKYTAQFDAAQKAPESLAGAQRIREALSGAALTGAGADWMLTGAKVAAQAGFNTGNAAADTEMLQKELASATLDAIASSGLGSGQGFTDNDRKFLQQAKSGQIQMQRETLLRVAALKEKAAISSIKQWNATAARLNPQQVKELGMSRIDMPTAPDQPPGSAPKLKQNQDGTYEYSP